MVGEAAAETHLPDLVPHTAQQQEEQPQRQQEQNDQMLLPLSGQLILELLAATSQTPFGWMLADAPVIVVSRTSQAVLFLLPPSIRASSFGAQPHEEFIVVPPPRGGLECAAEPTPYSRSRRPRPLAPPAVVKVGAFRLGSLATAPPREVKLTKATAHRFSQFRGPRQERMSKTSV